MRLVRFARRAFILVGGLVLLIGVAAPPANGAADLPDLVVTAAFDQASYELGDTATAIFTIKNKGPVTAPNVHVSGGDSSGLDQTTGPTAGFDLDPGESGDVTVVGTVNDIGHAQGLMFVALGFDSDMDDANPEDNHAPAKAQIIGAKGELHGKFFDEADDEGVPGVVIALYNDFTPTVKTAQATSGPDGTWALQDVPAGPYTFKVTLPPGWKLGEKMPTTGALVTEGDNGEVTISLVAVPIPPTTPPTTEPPGGGHGGLPTTGSPVALIAGLGGAILLVGVGLVLAARRRRRTS